MIRKWIAALVIISILGVLAACSSPTSSTRDSADVSSADDSAQEDSFVSFETTDLDGNTVSSSDIFRENRITMVNIWGTFCGPCIDELPELEKLRYRLEKKGCGIVGIVSDVEGIGDSGTIGEAKELIDEIGVRYLNLIPWDETWDVFPAQYIPTTYFIDSKGKIIGEPAVGARSEDAYEDLIDALLEKYE